jgi:hypothetical protein
MLHGVHFPDPSTHNHAGPSRTSTRRAIYTNRHLATPLLDLTLLLLRSPIPSIALLISPLSSLHRIISAIIQAFTIAIRARLGVLSVANTSVIWWATGLGTEAEEEKGIDDSLGPSEDLVDGRLLATCESGPPLEVRVPGLETVRWDRLDDVSGESLGNRRGKWEWFKRWGLSRVQEVGPLLLDSYLLLHLHTSIVLYIASCLDKANTANRNKLLIVGLDDRSSPRRPCGWIIHLLLYSNV